MRFLGIGESNDLAALYYGLVQRGHEVRVFVRDPAYQTVYAGMLDFTDDWNRELGWLRAAGDHGFVVFETATDGATQDSLRRDGFRVIGGSALGDQLEADREFGQAALRSIGLRTAASHTFRDYGAAQDFIKRRPGRYVLKLNGANALRTRNFVGTMDDGFDMLAVLGLYQARQQASESADFVLMDHLEGVEIGVGAYFNGENFLSPACIDFEHKRFFPGDLGELTGEMGTIVSYRFSSRIFATVLQPLAGLLREGRYCGYINVNLIANDKGLWPLEFTSRFGYPGFAICEALHREPWESIFTALVQKDRMHFETRSDFAAGVVLTVPPFPYSHGYEDLSKGMPICLRDGLTPSDRTALSFSEVAMHGDQLVTSGAVGYVGVATGTGTTPSDANEEALRIADAVVVPNLRYRRDIGERVTSGGWHKLKQWGWVD